MRKEVLIAIIIGFALGLVITFGIWTTNQALKKSATEKPTPVEEVVSPTPILEEKFSLVLHSPENNSISVEETIEVSGETAPSAIIVILYQEGEKILEADEKGEFSTEVALAGGSNEITVSAYNQEGDEISQTLTVVYSTAEI